MSVVGVPSDCVARRGIATRDASLLRIDKSPRWICFAIHRGRFSFRKTCLLKIAGRFSEMN